MKTINLPKRAVITNGMPYGNKALHLGHAMTFILSDFYARFLRDRIGKDNVIYICGTDGFGSTSEEKYRKAKESGETNLTIAEYVKGFHDIQKEILKKFHISLNRFYGSFIDPGFTNHKEISAYFFTQMLKNGKLEKRETLQFYDEKVGCFLNGRQVVGKCPIEGCKSEKANADDCDLGHQFNVTDLIDPISTLSGTKPTLKKVTNYYLPLDSYRDAIFEILNRLKEDERVHKFMVKEMRDYLTRPTLYIDLENQEKLKKITLNNVLEQKIDEKHDRIELTFEKVSDRDVASDVLSNAKIRYKSNKTLAPIRITGNASWGVPVPEVEPQAKGLTFYVWPESLWAPISFTKTYLKEIGSNLTWQDWWCDKDSQVYQFIGEDNIYYYGLAQPAIFMAANGKENIPYPENGKLQMTNIVDYKHILLNGLKASSSGSTKPIMANDLLDHYTYEQLRCHFLSMNTNTAAFNFKSKAFFPEDFANSGDPVVAQGNMLTNILNRLVRSVLYSIQTLFDNKIPNLEPSQEIVAEGIKIAEDYQEKAINFKFSDIIILLDEYFRKANQTWSAKSKSQDLAEKAQLIVDSIHIIKTSLPLIHPIAPEGAELVAKYLKMDDRIWNWDNIEKTYTQTFGKVDNFEFLEPKFDFFKKHPSQI